MYISKAHFGEAKLMVGKCETREEWETYDLCDMLLNLVRRDTAILLEQLPRPGQLRPVLGQVLLIAHNVV